MTPESLVAERDAAQLVAIAPEDARIWSSPAADLAFTDDTEVAAALRINEALRIHGRKA